MRKETFLSVDPIANASSFMEAFSLSETAKAEVEIIFGVIVKKEGRFFREQDRRSVKATINETKELAENFTDMLLENRFGHSNLKETYDFCYSAAEANVWDDQEFISRGASLAFTATVGKKLFETVAWEGVRGSFDRLSAGSNFDYLSDLIIASGSISDHAISLATIKKSKKERNPYLPLVKLMSIGAIGFHFSLDDNSEGMAVDFAIKEDEKSKIMTCSFPQDFKIVEIGSRDWGEPLAGFVQLT